MDKYLCIKDFMLLIPTELFKHVRTAKISVFNSATLNMKNP